MRPGCAGAGPRVIRRRAGAVRPRPDRVSRWRGDTRERRQYGRAVLEYVPRRVGGETSRFVEWIWFARGRITGVRERIAPTGSTVAAVVLGDPIRQTPVGEGTALVAETGFLIGPHDRPIVNEPQGETFCVGIITTPLGCRPALGLAPVTLRGRVVDLLRAWPRAAGLRCELMTCRTPVEALDVVEATLRTPEPFDRHAFARCEGCGPAALGGTLPVRLLTSLQGSGVSHGHPDRQFTDQVGLSPRTLARILRMRRLLEEIDVHGSVGWADKAAELGWSDQAHLIRDFNATPELRRRSTSPPNARATTEPKQPPRPDSCPRRGEVRPIHRASQGAAWEIRRSEGLR
jgi:AraC-like DNA-binding protein